MKNIGIIGLGLIGGSMALAIKKIYPAATLYGRDTNHLAKALELHLIDKELTDTLIPEMELIIIATPIDSIPVIADNILHKIDINCLIFDVGSTKSKIAKKLKNHPKRQNFLLSHPIAGTEYSGPEAAFSTLFENKMNIVCDTQLTAPKIYKKAIKLFKHLKMNTIEMDSQEHDRHIAYVSHLSHISSFMLGKTVLDLEKDENNIFQMAGSGFASTVRLAKSSPQTWTPIFLENKEPILQSLDEFIDNLNHFKTLLYREDHQTLLQTLTKINHIGKIIDKIS